MKKIDLPTQKTILVNLLAYTDNICKENNINYSLLGGSLIGAIRHNGFIPWDDDIDIVLMPKDYKKLISVLSRQNKRYKLLDPATDGQCLYPFAKLVDSRTILRETNAHSTNNYGVYLDIFSYHYISNNKFVRRIHYAALVTMKKLISFSILSPSQLLANRELLKIFPCLIANFISNKILKKIYLKLCNKTKPTKFIISNWPAYGYKKEIQKSSSFSKYSRHKFETIDAMICEDYGNVLSTTFGNYMQLPPKSQRVTNHHTQAWWREDNHNRK